MQSRNKAVLEFVLDDLGQRSAQAQGLGAVITTVRKMMHTDQRVYIHRSDRAINGMIKVGRKNLFIRDNASGKMHEINPLCVLDFYVHESVQRGGIGKQLFEEMLGKERLDPSEFGYDRPSPKLMGFLRKHYGLVDFDHQPNNFVVFKQYFKKATSAQRKHD
jgi:alpha-tubulin N-acetyltransferase 1